MQNNLRQMFCLSKSGDLVPIKLGVRLNATLDNGIQYCGALNFSLKKNLQTCVVFTSKEGLILAMSESGKRYFTPRTNMNDYNKEFKFIFRVSFFG